MRNAILNILMALAALMFCWVPPLYATYDAIRRDRGSFVDCQRREWNRWWDVYMDVRDVDYPAQKHLKD